MGLLDMGGLLSSGPLSSPDAKLGLAAGLLSGTGNWGANLSKGILAGEQAAQQDRANRQNDLQQLQGLYGILQQQEAMRWAQAKSAGQPYSPSPQFVAVENRLAQMAGSSNLSNLSGPPQAAQGMPQGQAPQGPTGAPQGPVTGLAAPSASPMANPGYQPPAAAVRPNDATPAPASQPQGLLPQQTSGFGAPAGGLDMADYMMSAMNPGLKMYTEQYAKDHSVQNARQGGYIMGWNPDGTPKPMFYAAKLDPGVQPTFGPNGQITSASAIPGYAPAVATIKGAEAGATQEAKQGKTYVDVPIGGGQTMRMTNEQYQAMLANRGQSQTIPQAVIDADKTEQPFTATQSPGSPVQFQQGGPQVAKVTVTQPSPLLNNPGMGALGITPNPAALAGAVENAKAAAGNQQNVAADDYKGLAQQNATAQTVISRLQTIKQLGPEAITGAEAEKRDFMNGLLSLAGLQSAKDAKTASDLVDKNASQIALAIGTGPSGTDALRSLAQMANPNRHMTVEALQAAANSIIATLQMTQAKTQMLTPYFTNGDAKGYFQQKQTFEQSADPRLWELQALPLDAQKAYVSNLSPADAKALLAKRQALRQMGVLQ